jgi:hypothetical protein
LQQKKKFQELTGADCDAKPAVELQSQLVENILLEYENSENEP